MINNIGNLNPENITGNSLNKTGQLQGAEGLRKNPYATFNRDYLMDESQISKDAIKLYEMEKDVKSFTKLAMSAPEDDVQTEAMMQTLFSKGVVDIDDSDIWAQLSQNDDLISDIMG